MSSAAISIEGFISNELTIRNAGDHRVVDVSVPHTPQKREGNEWVDAGPTTWLTATFWDEHADEVLNSAGKGSLVILSGRPELEVYAKNDGTPGGKIKVVFPTLAVVVRKPKRGQSAPAESWPTAAPGSGDVWNTPTYNDETPF